MTKDDLVKWVKDYIAKGHELEKILSHLKTQGYSDNDIVELRAHLAGKKKSSEHLPGSVFAQVMSWLYGVFFEPESTMKEVAEHGKNAHVYLMGAISIGALLLTFILDKLVVEGTATLPSQILEKASIVIAPQGGLAAMIAGELTVRGIVMTIIATSVYYFLPLLGIAFVAHLLLHGLYHKSTTGKAFRIIGIPYGAAAIMISFLTLGTSPFLFIAEQLGSTGLIAKILTFSIVIMLVLIIFMRMVVSLYSYVAYAMVMKEKYETTMQSSIMISIVATSAVLLALMPLIELGITSLF